MADAESIHQAAQVRTPFSAWLGVVLLFALFGVIVLAVIGPSPRGDTYEQKRAKAREEKLKAARADDAKALTTYSWIDKQKDTVRIPIQRAMELAVTELAQKKPAPAGPIATPEPQASAVATGAATPSPAATASPSPTGTPKATSVAGPSSESRNQPAAAVNPPPAPPGTQPGASASPAASPAQAAAAQPKSVQAPQQTPAPSPSGTPTPAAGKTP